MSEYIEREDVEKAIADIRGIYRKAKNFNAVSAIDNAAGEIRECVKNADVAPVVHGKWNGWHGDKMVDEETKRKYHYYECSECRRRCAVKSRFCPNCGAKMDGGKK